MPRNITKDFQKVFQAFSEGKEAVGGKVSIGNGSGVRCSTDGFNFWSYKMLIAKRFQDNCGKLMYVVIAEEYAPSNTTRRHVRALMNSLEQAQIVREGSILTWDFKFSGNY
jgi:hypothetical protein